MKLLLIITFITINNKIVYDKRHTHHRHPQPTWFRSQNDPQSISSHPQRAKTSHTEY